MTNSEDELLRDAEVKMKTIDDVIQKLEYIMESDPRTFSNPECEYGWVFHRINEAIKMLKEIEKEFPPAEPEQRWIPVSEKLPDPDVDVLLQLSDVMATGYYFYDGWHVYFSPKRKDVIAWRELPEPYKGGQE